MLPGIDGIEVMRQLHEEPGAPIAVIMLTARGEESDRLVGLRQGADDYVVKPFSPAELVARVDLKADRCAGLLRVPGAFSEPRIANASHMVTELAAALKEMAQWLQLDGIAVGQRGDLAAALGSATRAGAPVRMVPR